MKILLDEIPEEGLSVDLSEEGDALGELAAGGLDFEIKGPVKAHLDVNKADGNVLVRGFLDASLVLECSRCTAGYEFDIDTDFHVFFVRGKEGAGEKELHKSDLEVSYIDTPELDTDELLLAQLALEVPMKPLCREDCKGLCPKCGADLNEGDCGCEREERVDPRFAALKDFKVKGGKG